MKEVHKIMIKSLIIQIIQTIRTNNYYLMFKQIQIKSTQIT